ncbi:hypothetical protein TgHK011_004877 [Trichoderma gracile]|nr:hypothetical protein TgHK011_004877 [Trichoderma gracile]
MTTPLTFALGKGMSEDMRKAQSHGVSIDETDHPICSIVLLVPIPDPATVVVESFQSQTVDASRHKFSNMNGA